MDLVPLFSVKIRKEPQELPEDLTPVCFTLTISSKRSPVSQVVVPKALDTAEKATKMVSTI